MFNLLVQPFRLFICLWMVCCCEVPFNAQQLKGRNILTKGTYGHASNLERVILIKGLSIV